VEKTVGLIPARFHSVRFPGKPLALLGGKPMVLHVLEAARASRRLDRALVATDDERIARVVLEAGGEVAMTSREATSGTDRLAEAARSVPAEVYVNVQGDEPMMSPENIDLAVETLLADEKRAIATLAIPIAAEEASDPNVVKVVIARDGRGLYFSRSPIPYFRSGQPLYWKHLGLYAYRAAVLSALAALPPSPLECAEALEQLRWLEAGYPIAVGRAATDSIGVDTPGDLERAERLLRAGNRKHKEVVS
jgi:3-deoxy-manno-octulosonate cytidylyltransferase (CMP-KDO synthetase)